MSGFSRIYTWFRTHRLDIAISLVILVVALLPRVLDLGTFLTADEKTWMQRSYEFVRAFKDARFNEMLQTTHPGVTATWIMGLSITAKIFLSGTPFSFQTLPSFIVAAQLPIAVATSLAIPGIFGFLRAIRLPFITSIRDSRMFAIAASLFIALNPFLIGYSRVAHVDALFGSFLCLAVLSTILYTQRDFQRTWLVVSAVLSALAILTKAPGIFMIPFWWLAVLLPISTLRITRQEVVSHLAARARDFLLWILLVGILFILIWPVFIGVENPKGNANILKRDLGIAASTPHHMSEGYSLEGSHYIYTVVTRTTPVVGLLALTSIGVVWLAYTRKLSRIDQHALWLLWGFAIFFIIMMTLGAKKGDRYILPIFFAIDILAAVGIMGILTYVRKSRWTVPAVVLVVGYLAVVTASYHPYTIAYANPLLPDNLSQELGWGEGLEQVATWLNENDPNVRVASWYDVELSMFTSTDVLSVGAHGENTVKYVVLYNNMFGRAADHPANDYIDEYYTKRDPVFVAYVREKPMAWVYEKKIYSGVYGELLPGDVVSRSLPVEHDDIAGFEVLIATYLSRATQGFVIAEAIGENGQVLQGWQVSVADIEDDRWHRFLFTPGQPEIDQKNITVRLRVIGTQEGNAPTVRRDTDGEAAARILYFVDGELAHEEQDRLFPDN